MSASVNCPPYGLLEVLKTESITRDNVAQIESIAHRAAELLMPIVGSAAPEGCLPWNKTDENWTRLPSGLQNMLKSLAISQDDSNLRKTSQLVLICCWRSMREVSAILGKSAGYYSAFASEMVDLGLPEARRPS